MNAMQRIDESDLNVIAGGGYFSGGSLFSRCVKAATLPYYIKYKIVESLLSSRRVETSPVEPESGEDKVEDNELAREP